MRGSPVARRFWIAGCLKRRLPEHSSTGNVNSLGIALAALEAAGDSRDVDLGSKIHADASQCEAWSSSIYFSGILVKMYVRCGSLAAARDAFHSMRLAHGSANVVVAWNVLMLGYVENGEEEKALQLFDFMRSQGATPDARTLLAAVKAITLRAAKETRDSLGIKLRGLDDAMALHSSAKGTCELDVFVASSLMDLYGRCGSMADARRVFDRMKNHDLVSWTALILGHIDNGDGELALELFSCMQTQGSCVPDARAFVAALQACGSIAGEEEGTVSFLDSLNDRKLVKWKSLQLGMAIHSQTASQGLDTDPYVTSSLIDMYSKCGSVTEARKVFDRMSCPTVVSWNVMILGYVEDGQEEVALEVFEAMQHRGYTPDARTFVAAFKACSSLAATEKGALVDGRMVKSGCLQRASSVHRKAASCGCDREPFVANSLLDTYCKCGSVEDAVRVFEKMKRRDAISWTVLLLGYVESRKAEAALDLLAESENHITPDPPMFVAALKACSSLAAGSKLSKLEVLERGMAIHTRARRFGCDGDTFVANALVDLYAKCGSILDSRMVFDSMPRHSMVSWNSLVQAYAENGEEKLALEVFAAAGTPDHVTYTAALKACASLSSGEEATQIEDGTSVKLRSLEKGMELHCGASRRGYEVANSVLDMYAKCGSLVDARRVFDTMLCSSIVSWNSLLLGYAGNGESEVALGLFAHLQHHHREVCDARTYAAALKACSACSAATLAKSIHAVLCRDGLLDIGDAVLVSCMVDAYAKSGLALDAQQVFDSTQQSFCVITWNALMTGYCARGESDRVLGALQSMKDEGLKPDAITLVSILSACSHTGLVEMAKSHFEALVRGAGGESTVGPVAEHYHCMIDTLGRANRLEEAMVLVDSMPFTASGVTWSTLLAACCKWNNVAVGKAVFDRFVESDIGSRDSAGYMLMVKLYGSSGLWKEQSFVLQTMAAKFGIFSSGISNDDRRCGS
ncbi:pentatricopeptide repeat-containing protein At2g13600-like [Selaginella moellendorffii]|uniref:pentatricopeptide repeat-containing protein At2g13600-like n=1 Tax=Selaginella moellendorffii TaxID=88036 RepID=UPI000D1CAF33|nr:pentatricopeptide repeat-containing protein At2g13600-like [Selaginella moellendorffii]|eukprot:XP_024543462.1 pentatricopeptide repeat-containing protein At2g13600-like [Selaginella moellendorffii]